MKKISLVAISLVAVTAASLASAALSVEDLSMKGDGLLTVDADTGLAWLDVASTRGMSAAQAESSTWFAQGFRFATSVELDALVAHGDREGDYLDWMGAWAASPELSAYAGGPTVILSGAVGGDGVHLDGQLPVETLMLSRDVRVSPSSTIFAYGPSSDSDLRSTLIYRDEARPLWDGVSLGSFLRRQSTWTTPIATSPEIGVYLVKEVSVVPEPCTFLLMGLGLVGVSGLAGRVRHPGH